MIQRQCCAGLAAFALGMGCLATSEAQAAPSIRVLLASDVQRLEVQADQVLWATDAQDRAQAHRSLLRIELRGHGIFLNGSPAAGGHVTLRAGDQDLKLWLPRKNGNGTGNGASIQLGDEKTALQVSGSVQVVRRGKGLLVVNQVDLEEYVKGVVPSEVNSSWHPEMLKAQAVAARTYALYQHMLSASRDYDVAASIQDQVYRGRQGVDARVEQAVESTRGLVITHQGAPIYAAFSSTAAGITEDAMVVWSKDLPYLKGVECPFDLESPYYQWKASFTVEGLEKNLRQLGFPVGTIATLTPLSHSRAGRVATLRILHSKGELILRGEELRKAVGYTVVPSTQFTIESFGHDIVLTGYGAGHAVGLCQWGAKELAELGYSFSSILRYYYPGTELQNAALTQAPPVPPTSAF
ncbi:MAG: SpoIID/LytB domain-containing protein [Nitrospira sp.]|nr:SpoIID/LytB domain-containing protein [Nitrospira sp.]MDH5252456.1 SpoIID/LytB domain-containing protein [Nitrospira sp.]MDH5624941.1 SpoIID/LytB domain-containing protein [Nitrospira sp.]